MHDATHANPIHAVILVGPPGAGKGTQGRILGTIPGFVHWEAGKVLRSLDPNSEIGKKTKAVVDRGDLLPDELVIEIFRSSLPQREDWSDATLILDGLPRTRGQARMVRSLVDIFLVLHLVAPDAQSLVRRLARRASIEGRQDDVSEQIVRHRLGVYERETAPVLEEFPKDSIVDIDAMRAPAAVTHEILGHILGRRPGSRPAAG